MWQKGCYRSVLPQDHLIIVKPVSVPQSAQFFPSLKILDGPSARSREIVMGNRVLHALQICVDTMLRFVERAE
jgi:hypothetical protein